MIRPVPSALLLAFAALLVAGVAQAASCPPPAKAARAADRSPADCTKSEKFVPYDPEPVRSRGGFVDLGNGTEVRVGGRARMDYDTRR